MLATEISGQNGIHATVNPVYARQHGYPDLVNVSSHVEMLDIHRSADQKISLASKSSFLTGSHSINMPSRFFRPPLA
jgi:hypothetical protein